MKKDGKIKPEGWSKEGKKGNSKPKKTPAAMYRKGRKIEKYGGGGDPGGGGDAGGAGKPFPEEFDRKRRLLGEDVYRKGHKVKKKRYGGSVSYNSSSVVGYSKSYGGMGGEDE
jgi:hypothetical protein